MQDAWPTIGPRGLPIKRGREQVVICHTGRMEQVWRAHNTSVAPPRQASGGGADRSGTPSELNTVLVGSKPGTYTDFHRSMQRANDYRYAAVDHRGGSSTFWCAPNIATRDAHDA
jgi:hypothetical protein